ncbi:ficolin-2-like [Ixodes scapularis]|uniref:ficolin-2-like n=1 Tax=Ixodes scapularis TaxID=6945 RepID=UPI001A9CE77B|nr:ficolin-2-like [Ixodes scapularis]
MRTSDPLTKDLNMFVAVLFLPVVAGNLFMESSLHSFPKITERSGYVKTYMIFDPCNMNKPGNRTVSCAQLKMEGNNETRDYLITPYTNFNVRCDMDTNGGGWTVIQRRSWDELEGNGFEKSEKDYEEGFRGGASSYWIGLNNIHALTSHPSSDQVLRIELKTLKDETIIVQYGKFKVGPKKDGYRLTIGDYTSPNGPDYDGLAFHDQTTFSVVKKTDRVDPCSGSLKTGGWWFPPFGCSFSNLNGRKLKGDVPKNNMGFGITWYKTGDFDSYRNGYKSVEMKVRDVDFELCMGRISA